MRLFFIFLAAIALMAGCKNNDQKTAVAGNNSQAANAAKDSANFTTVEWLDSAKNFGKINEGQKLEVAFRFKNIGDKPLVIDRVQPSCGCTVAEQPQEPIAPGAEGVIKATFNSEGHPGINHKTLSVYANTKESHDQGHPLQFDVEVIKKEAAGK